MASPWKRKRKRQEQLLHSPDPSLPLSLDATPLQSDKTLVLSNATRLASALLDAATRSSPKLAAAHNSSAWPLSADLTIKVFSMLDSESVCAAATACSLFSRCASDSLCYQNIDLTWSVAKVTNSVVSTIIQRAAKDLRSIKLGRLLQNIDRLDENEDEDDDGDDDDDDESPITGSCLAALTLDGGAAGLLLQKLHLCNIQMNDYDLCSALSACKSLSELEIVGIDICYQSILATLIEHCHSIERLTFDIRANQEFRAIKDLTKTCPLLSSLSLRGFGIRDDTLAALVKGACCLRYLDLSASVGFRGSFLRDLSDYGCTNSLETLILRDCMTLRADISNRKGLLDLCEEFLIRSVIDVTRFKGRPDIHFIAEYPREICFYDGCPYLPSSADDDSSSLSEASSSDDGADEYII